jgi:hypothetical protein
LHTRVQKIFDAQDVRSIDKRNWMVAQKRACMIKKDKTLQFKHFFHCQVYKFLEHLQKPAFPV